jgi:hypothetical protein
MQPLISHRGGTIFHVNIKKTPVNPFRPAFPLSKFCPLKIDQLEGVNKQTKKTSLLRKIVHILSNKEKTAYLASNYF